MPQKVKGYQIADGRFFETFVEANYEEAKLALIDTARSAIEITQMNTGMLIDFLDKYPDIVISYCEAYKALSNEENTIDELLKMQEGEILNGTSEEPSTIENENEEDTDRSGIGRSTADKDNSKVPNIQHESKS